ncbi:hypothetical protein [Zobellella denitrificans]
MNANQDFNQLYRDVAESMAAAMEDVENLTVSHGEGRQRLANITQTLREIQKGFDEELEFLETNAEWEKFTMAFFGETNAGKSTIIESLRILFNESSRQQLIEENRGNLDGLSRQLHAHADQAQTELTEVFQKHAQGVAAIRKDCAELNTIMKTEAAERIRLDEEKTAILKEETAERTRLAKEAASLRVKRNLAITGMVGMLLGVGIGIASATFLALGA